MKSFPEEVRRAFGKAILELKNGTGLTYPLSKPIPSVERGVEELRLRDRAGIYRIFYLTRSERGILIFHAFIKKTQKTPQNEIDLAKKRLREMINE